MALAMDVTLALRIGIVFSLAFAGLASAQPVPPSTPQRVLLVDRLIVPTPPPLPHEQNPQRWPQPDYFDDALKRTGFAPSQRAASLTLRPMNAGPLPDAIVLPVQSQAFGFSAAFRALVGAHLDVALERAGLAATRQTDIVDGYGPFVRRLEEESIDALGRDNPRRKLVILYVGHDGATRAFVTLQVRDGAARRQAHATLPLPEDAEAAESAIAGAVPALFVQLGIHATNTPSSIKNEARCSAEAWTLGPVPLRLDPSERACRAVVIGTLLPTHERYQYWIDEALSPAKLAWLAQAYVEADALGSDSAQAIREIAARQLGLPQFVEPATMLRRARLVDPVVSRLAALLSLGTAKGLAPVRSIRETRDREIAKITVGLPPFAAALVQAHSDFPDPFLQTDICEIEAQYQSRLMRPVCSDPRTVAKAPDAGTSSPVESLLYQEWRLATYIKRLLYFAGTLGDRAKAMEVHRRLPPDVAQHPFAQRMVYELIDRAAAEGNFNDLLARNRGAARRVVQSTVDLQRYDTWLARNTLNEHLLVDNLNILNDEQVNQSMEAELRLLAVLDFDRFAFHGLGNHRREPGEGAIHMVEPVNFIRGMRTSGSPAARRMSEAASAPPATPAAPASPVVIHPTRSQPPLGLRELESPSIEKLADQAQRVPMDMDARVSWAVELLKEGTPLTKARQIIDARPGDQQRDFQVSESHAWAAPGHTFFFAGELAAARDYYQRARDIGTGSSSDLLSRARLYFIDGRLADALAATQARLARYGSDYVRRDLAGLLFMYNRPAEAWQVILPRAAAADTVQLWAAAYTGHRIVGADLPTIGHWLTDNGLDQVQLDRSDLGSMYLHMHAVIDRIPSESDIAVLEQRRSSGGHYVDPRWAVSARLLRSVMQDQAFEEAYRAASPLLSKQWGQRTLFLLPAYVWTASRAGQQSDPVVSEVLDATLRAGFDVLLAKSMLLALGGRIDESLRFFDAARFTFYDNATTERPLSAPYEHTLAGVVMYHHTKREEYRRQVLIFVRAYQRVHPFLGWTYSAEALLEQDPSRRFAAACRAQFLDPHSHFLSEAKVSGVSQRRCPASLWR